MLHTKQYDQLTTEEKTLVDMDISNHKKSLIVAYILWLFLGGFGAHRFYFKKNGSAITMLVLWLLGSCTLLFYVGDVLLFALGIWWIIDAFLIPGWGKESIRDLEKQSIAEILISRNNNSTDQQNSTSQKFQNINKNNSFYTKSENSINNQNETLSKNTNKINNSTNKDDNLINKDNFIKNDKENYQ